MPSYLVTGGSGQLGQCFHAVAKESPAINLFFTSRNEVDITRSETLANFYSKNPFLYQKNNLTIKKDFYNKKKIYKKLFFTIKKYRVAKIKVSIKLINIIYIAIGFPLAILSFI